MGTGELRKGYPEGCGLRWRELEQPGTQLEPGSWVRSRPGPELWQKPPKVLPSGRNFPQIVGWDLSA